MLNQIITQIVSHPKTAFFNLFAYKAAPGKWHCSVSWDDDRKMAMCGDGATPEEAASRVLKMLNGEIPKGWK